MRECGGCTLCCKIPRIVCGDFRKESNTVCQHCEVGKGCSIYVMRPKTCKEFHCHWVESDMPDFARPDRVGFYVKMEGDVAKVYVDPARPWAWHSSVVSDLRLTKHVLVQVDRNLIFVPSVTLPMPEKLNVEWTL